jgi:glyoxylase-like metal-dependent hydrolase (beta-lactamase superfamily II)
VDSPVLPGEAEAVRDDLAGAGLTVAALAVTHADWDHVLCPGAFPGVPVLMARSTARRLAAGFPAIAREVARFDRARGDVPRVPAPPGETRVVDPPATAEVAGTRVEVVPAEGHTADGAAFVLPHLGLLLPGDYLSPVEEPLVDPGGTAEEYLRTLDRLAALLPGVRLVVPGHGHPLSPERAGAVLDAHRRHPTLRRGTP